MSDTVFVVTTGSYSDKKIRGIFSLPHYAQDLADVLPDANDIEAYDLNPETISHPKGCKLWDVWMRQDGVEAESYPADPYGEDWYGFHNGSDYHIRVWAKDPEGAAKIANEKRVQIMALNLWGQDEETIKKAVRI